MRLCLFIFSAFVIILGCSNHSIDPVQVDSTNQSLDSSNEDYLSISRQDYLNKLHGFWLGASIANWTGRVTEMDKIGGDGPNGGPFYTRDDWGKMDLPNQMGRTGVQLSSGEIFDRIDWALEGETGIWGSDDDTDIEYIYQYLLLKNETSILSDEQIRNGWITHIYSDENTPFIRNGRPENWLWVSNQAAHDLMLEKGLMPPATSDPENNFFYDMIDAQLTTEIFGLFAPARPDIAIEMAHLPIRVTAFEDAEWIAKFYVEMHSLASSVDQNLSLKEQTQWMAKIARLRIPDNSYTAKMFDFVNSLYNSGISWEQARDKIYIRYQVNQLDGYDILSTKLLSDSDPNSDNGFYQTFVNCHGCFAAGINFAASIISLLYGEGDFQETVKIASLSGWDSDNPAATWGGLLGFMIGKEGLEGSFNRKFSDRYNIHRTRGGFPNNGIDNFQAMAEKGLLVIDRVVEEEMGGRIDFMKNQWIIPLTN
ncbi:MAG: heme biosynthesis protein HemY [Gammaproteobacteria bacterium TMED78]|nr:MAG: heme biosynthesis protein HemY [Gammaproteobacteria bacterium TMED78]